MIKKNIFIIALSLLSLFTHAQYRVVNNNAFNKGEKLTYRLGFHSALTGTVTAGRATLEITKESPYFNGRPSHHIVVVGKTSGVIEMFYKVNDRFESYVDEQGIFPWKFERHVRENKYRHDDIVNFRQKEKIAVSLEKTTPIPMYSQDMISVFYYARTLDLSSYTQGQSIQIPFFLDDSVYYSKIVFLERKQIKTKAGTFSCIGLAPMVAQGKVFTDAYPIKMWVTDDANHIPVFVEAKLRVGSARVELLTYEGLSNPTTSRK